MSEFVYSDGIRKSKTITHVGLNMFCYDQKFRMNPFHEKDKACQLCLTPFKEGEPLSLALVKGERNHVICSDCTNCLINVGVVFVRHQDIYNQNQHLDTLQ